MFGQWRELHSTLLSTSRFLMHPVKCLYCSCGYSYDKFSLTPPSWRTWLPFRYLEAESNSKHTKKASQNITITLTISSPKTQWQEEKRNTHTHTCALVTFLVSFYHFRIWISPQASSGYIKIFPQQQAKQMSAVIFRAPHTMGMIHGHCFYCRFSFLMNYQITWNSHTVITKKSVKIRGVFKRTTIGPSPTLLFAGNFHNITTFSGVRSRGEKKQTWLVCGIKSTLRQK